MPAKTPLTLEERMLQAELLQEEHERDMQRLGAELSCVKEIACEAKEMALATNGLIENMPERVIKALAEKGRGKRLEFREWLNLLAALVMVAAAFYTAFGG